MKSLPKESFVKPTLNLETLEENPMGGGREARPENSHSAKIWNSGEAAGDPEVLVMGYGKIRKSQAEAKVEAKLMELMNFAKQKEWDKISAGLLPQETLLKALVKSLYNANNYQGQ